LNATLFRLAGACMLLCAASAAQAGVDPIVYADDMPQAGEPEFELVARSVRTAHAGPYAGRHALLSTLELDYGLSERWAVALKAPVSRIDGKWRAEGAYAEAKYLAPRDAGGWYWGVEAEAGGVRTVRGGEREFELEVVPILGLRSGPWHLAANAGLEYTSDRGGIGFAPKLKAAYQLTPRQAVGVEYQNERLDAPQARGRNAVAYLTWDASVGEHGVGLALGHGTTRASEKWSVRLRVDLDL
jgi:hypothetical protein